MNNDPLQQLFISESQAVNRQELAELLLPYVVINKETNEFDFTGEFMALPNAEKIFIILLAVKARNLVHAEIEDRITPSEIIKLEVAPEGSIKATLKSLLDSNQIKSDKGKYYLPNFKIQQIVVKFKNLKNHGNK